MPGLSGGVYVSVTTLEAAYGSDTRRQPCGPRAFPTAVHQPGFAGTVIDKGTRNLRMTSTVTSGDSWADAPRQFHSTARNSTAESYGQLTNSETGSGHGSF